MGMSFFASTLNQVNGSTHVESVFPMDWLEMFDTSPNYEEFEAPFNPSYREDLDMHLAYGNARVLLKTLGFPMDDYSMLEPIDAVIRACELMISNNFSNHEAAGLIGYATRLKHIALEGKKHGATHISGA